MHDVSSKVTMMLLSSANEPCHHPRQARRVRVLGVVELCLLARNDAGIGHVEKRNLQPARQIVEERRGGRHGAGLRRVRMQELPSQWMVGRQVGDYPDALSLHVAPQELEAMCALSVPAEAG